MKVLAIACAFSLLAAEADAISRYQTMRMSCEAVQDVLAEEGAAILRWSSRRDPSLPIYGRFVSGGAFCEWGEVATFASVPTRDDRSCNVYKCIRPDHFDRERRILIPN